MAHEHHHHDDAAYYTEQLCTIGITALIGLVSVMLYRNGQLNLLLAKKLQWTVLAGGIALLALAAVRGIALWMAAGRNRAAGHNHAHDHDHGHSHDHAHHHDHDHEHCDHHHHDHDHEHAVTEAPGHDHGVAHHHEPGPDPVHAGHDHGHDHDHSFNVLRYIILLIPVVLFFLGLPNEGFQIRAAEDVGQIGDTIGDGKARAKGSDAAPVGLGFLELAGAAYDPERRELYEGKLARLKGQFQSAGSDRYFSLVRYKMTCCMADAIPLPLIIMIDPASGEHVNPGAYQGKWVEVTGQVQFRDRVRNGQKEPVTVLLVRPDKDHPLEKLVEPTNPDNSPLQ
jgi:hypothetical protein